MATSTDQELYGDMVYSSSTTTPTYNTTAYLSPFTAPPIASSAAPSPAFVDLPEKNPTRHCRRKQRPAFPGNEWCSGERDISTALLHDDEDAWQHITDPKERRKVQNRIAQRKHREKAAQNRDAERRKSQNQLLAGGSYARLWVTTSDEMDPTQLAARPAERQCQGMGDDHCTRELSGVPWGGFAFDKYALLRRSDNTGVRLMSWEAEQRQVRPHFIDRQRLPWQHRQIGMHRRLGPQRGQDDMRKKRRNPDHHPRMTSGTGPGHQAQVSPPMVDCSVVPEANLACYSGGLGQTVVQADVQVVPNDLANSVVNTGPHACDLSFWAQPCSLIPRDTFFGGPMSYHASLQESSLELPTGDSLQHLVRTGGDTVVDMYPRMGY